MTNTKFRKRALLSSVAMLLVALVALGSATFAWFTDDPTAVASGFKAKAQTSTGLQIKTETDNEFKHSAEIGKGVNGFTLTPATGGTDLGSFFTTVASSPSARDANTKADNGTDNRKWTLLTSSQVGHESNMSGVYKEKISLRLSTTPSADTRVNLTDVVLNTTSGHPMLNGLTVQLQFGSTILTYNADAQPVGKYTTLSASTDVTVNPDGNWGTAATGLTNGTTQIGTLTASNNLIEGYVYVYLDGDDASVKSDFATEVGDIINSLTLNFAVPA